MSYRSEGYVQGGRFGPTKGRLPVSELAGVVSGARRAQRAARRLFAAALRWYRVNRTIDELSGLVFACCLVRPTGIDDLKPKSVTKKLKDKAFAAGVSRDEVAHGIELIGLERSEHIQNVIDGMRIVAEELGIRGEDVSG